MERKQNIINTINRDFAEKATDGTTTVIVNFNFENKAHRYSFRQFKWFRAAEKDTLGDFVAWELDQYEKNGWTPSCINTVTGDVLMVLNIVMKKDAEKVEFFDGTDFITL